MVARPSVSEPRRHPRVTDVDRLISTPDILIRRSATRLQANKDVYVESHGQRVAEVKAPRDAVLLQRSHRAVGTQHRSDRNQKLAYDVFQSGTLGDLTKSKLFGLSRTALAWTPRRLRSSARRTPMEALAYDQALPPLRSSSIFRKFRLYKIFPAESLISG